MPVRQTDSRVIFSALTNNLKPGVYVCGKVLSSTATLHVRKDNTGSFVRVRHEISTKPGVIEFEQLLDPAKDATVKVVADKVTLFPTFPEDKEITLKVDPTSIGEYKGKVRFTRAELVA